MNQLQHRKSQKQSGGEGKNDEENSISPITNCEQITATKKKNNNNNNNNNIYININYIEIQEYCCNR